MLTVMLTVTTGALAVFLLGVAAVLAAVSMRRLALGALACALTLGLAGAAFAVIGERRYERCVDREAARSTGRGPLSDAERRELRAVMRGQDTEPYVDTAPCDRGEALGLHDPF